MNATWLLCAALTTLLGGAATAFASGRARRRATAVFLATCLAGCLFAGTGGVLAASGATEDGVVLPWSVPGGSLSLRLDGLGGWFAFVVALVSAAAAVYAIRYLRDVDDRTFARFAGFFELLLVAVLVLTGARNGLLFLAAWEVMTLSAYVLIVLHHEDQTVRSAGLLYFVANHTAAFCLMALVAILGATAGSLDFDVLRASRDAHPEAASGAGLLFLLALVAFGTKAGMMPLHIWLPHAHPVAPTPVSAVLSGLIVKVGIFGLLRFLPFLPVPAAWFGGALLALGALSGVVGVLYALAQHDLKRLLAYHTVENIGIIVLGLGVGVVAARAGRPEIAALGFCGALLHVLNHALFKSLLFLGAGSVVHAAGTAEIDHLGGLARRMPWTALLFLVGCVSICALPPANGFVSEWLVYRALFGASAGAAGAPAIWCVGAILALALIGGLAAACFAKAFSATFLGVPRGAVHGHAGDAAVSQRVAMGALALACVLVGVVPFVAVRLAWPAASALAADLGRAPVTSPAEVAGWLTPFAW
ncbi:MAG TPA: proton-conducting transporter membrane subunit, partial [Planctomycetota bacterium]|nr:proton-conducting transporter membrane subunit [Planctomycetota bacterium]